MKTLVAFYSRTGHTNEVAKLIAKELKADIDEITDKTDRSGIRGWLGGGRDAFFRKPTEIEHRKDPLKYDLIVIGSPVWASTHSPATRAYLAKYKPKKVAFFCTFGGSEGKAFADFEAQSKKPLATLGLTDRKIKDAESLEKIKVFCRKIQK